MEKSKTEKSFAVFKKRKALIVVEGAAIVAVFGWLFFGRIWAGLLMSPGIVLYYRKRIGSIRRRIMDSARDSYRESLLVFKSALFAGLSAENAWKSATQEMANLYGDDEYTVVCMKNACRRLNVNESMEDVINYFAAQMRIEEAMDFAEVFGYAKRSGGNLSKILAASADRLTEKIQTERNIRTLLAGKKLEQLIMIVIPPAICFYLKVFSPGYLDPLYESAAGTLIMAVCLAVYLGACEISGKIADIRV